VTGRTEGGGGRAGRGMLLPSLLLLRSGRGPEGPEGPEGVAASTGGGGRGETRPMLPEVLNWLFVSSSRTGSLCAGGRGETRARNWRDGGVGDGTGEVWPVCCCWFLRCRGTGTTMDDGAEAAGDKPSCARSSALSSSYCCELKERAVMLRKSTASLPFTSSSSITLFSPDNMRLMASLTSPLFNKKKFQKHKAKNKPTNKP
jgi:hypothetical protein